MDRVVIALIVAYVLGSLNGAYYLIRLSRGQDVRSIGSGSAGATNAARALGRSGFATVFAWDVAKGAAAVLAGKLAGLGGWPLGGVVVLVMIGHIWPVQLGFRGGRGVATAWGAFLAFEPRIALVESLCALAGALILRRTTVGGLLGIVVGAIAIGVVLGPCVETTVLATVVGLAMFTHRGHIAATLRPARVTGERST